MTLVFQRCQSVSALTSVLVIDGIAVLALGASLLRNNKQPTTISTAMHLVFLQTLETYHSRLRCMAVFSLYFQFYFRSHAHTHSHNQRHDF